jgi:hypothetical protein
MPLLIHATKGAGFAIDHEKNLKPKNLLRADAKQSCTLAQYPLHLRDYFEEQR